MHTSISQAAADEDRILAFLDACHEAGIKDPVIFLSDKMPRLFGYLKGAFPRGIVPTDVDGEVELKGHFLRLEYKHDSSIRERRIPTGQLLCFEALRRTGKHTIFIVGHNDAGAITMLHILEPGGEQVIDPCDRDELVEMCKAWSKKIDPSFL